MNQKLMDDITRIAGVNPRKCMKCGKCSGACPAYDEMDYHPHQFVDMVENGRIDELLNSRGIYRCLSCFCLRRALPAQRGAGGAHRGGAPRRRPEAGRRPPEAGADPGAAGREPAAAGHHQRIPQI